MRARLVESLSNSFPGSALSKALHFMDTDASSADPLSSSCFAELRLDKSAPGDITPDEVDDELTNLEWLQSHDLLKNIETGDRSLCTSPIDDIQKENDVLGSRSHPPHIPYNPQKHVTSKPPYSFSCLIFMAIEESPTKKLPVKDIYDWIQVNFPYFRNAPTGWKNSVRHNLSLNKCFMKVEKDRGQGIGKGSYWCVDPNFRPNLLQALRRTPYHPYHQMQMVSSANNTHGSLNGQVHNLRNSFNEPSPHLFPFLSQRLAQTKVADSSDIDVANALVQLKRSVVSRRPLHCRNGWDGGHSRSPSPPDFGLEREKRTLRRKLRASRCRSPVVCTTNPSTDHTYSLTDDQIQEALLLSPSSSSVDEDYNFISDVDNDFDDDIDDHFDEDDEDDNDEGADNGDNDVSKDGKEDAKCQFLNESVCPKLNERQETRVIPPKNNIMTRSMSSRLRRKLPDLEDEEKKIREGADALLNLAGLGSLSSMQRESEKLKKKTAVPKKRSGLRIRLRKRPCKKTTPRSKTTCNNNNNNNRNNKNNNNSKKAKGADAGLVQIKTEPEDCLMVKVKDEVMDDE